MKSLRVAITTLGCKTNQFESEGMREALETDGFILVPFDAAADIYVINTCTVTAKTDAESRRIIRRARRMNPAGRVVVTGCYAQVAAAEIGAIPEVDLVIGNTEKKRIGELLRAVDPPRVLVSDIGRETTAAPLQLESHAEHTRAFLQIQNGCDAFCSYCIVPYARGRSRSVAPDEVLAAIARFASRGFREVVLSGIHLGAYGLDLDPPANLFSLAERVDREKTIPRLRLGSVEPQEVSAELIALMSSSATICPHLHIPLQSGSDPVLERMARRYTRSFAAELLRRLAAEVPGIFLGVDVIAGFPGETEAEFADTLTLLEELPVAALHVFPFSARKGTPAATMDKQVSPEAIRSRGALLRDLSVRKKRDFFAGMVGAELPVLFQEETGRGLRGLSRNYVPVEVPVRDPALLRREFIVRIEKTDGECCAGELLGELS